MRDRVLTASFLYFLLASCVRSDLSGRLQPIDEKRAGDYLVTALSPTGHVSTGKSEFVLEFRQGADGHLVDPGSVSASLSMPMTGMAPMIAPASVAPSDRPGRYRVKAEVSMAGTWYLTIRFDAGREVTLKLSAR